MPATGSTAASIGRYVTDALRDVLSVVFSVALAVNVVFWFHFIFGAAIHNYYAVVGYVCGVTFLHQVHLGIARAVRDPQVFAMKFDLSKMTWMMAKSADAVDPVGGSGQEGPRAPDPSSFGAAVGVEGPHD